MIAYKMKEELLAHFYEQIVLTFLQNRKRDNCYKYSQIHTNYDESYVGH